MAVETARPVRDSSYYWREPSIIPPEWAGNGAKILGIHGQAVEESVFHELHGGHFGDMRLPRYLKADRRGSFDVTVNLPKCASILEAMGDSRIGEVLTASTDVVKRELEQQAWTRNPWERNANLVLTSFRHGGSRADDPHLHDHIWFANLSLSSKGWKAVELGKSVDWEKIGDKARDAQMKGFRQLGYKVRRAGEEFEIVGVPAEVKAKFSRRHEQVKELEAEFEELKGRPLTSKAKSRLSLVDRPDKPDGRPMEERRDEWRGKLSDMQLDGLGRIVRQSHATIRHERWRDESRAAFDGRRRPVEQAKEAGRGRDR